MGSASKIFNPGGGVNFLPGQARGNAFGNAIVDQKGDPFAAWSDPTGKKRAADAAAAAAAKNAPSTTSDPTQTHHDPQYLAQNWTDYGGTRVPSNLMGTSGAKSQGSPAGYGSKSGAPPSQYGGGGAQAMGAMSQMPPTPSPGGATTPFTTKATNLPPQYAPAVAQQMRQASIQPTSTGTAYNPRPYY